MSSPAVTAAGAWREIPLLIERGPERLFAIVCEPAVAPAAIGVLIVVGGPQYRAGSHRQFVLLSRALAARGIAALRLDTTGMGDSTGALADFQATGADIAAALQAFRRLRPETRQFYLAGLCDGASALLLALLLADVRTAATGLCLINPWVRSQDSLATATVTTYYRRRLLSADFWARLARGSLRLGTLRKAAGLLGQALRSRVAGPAPTTPFIQRMAGALGGFDGRVLFVLSRRDFVADEFRHSFAQRPEWQAARQRTALHQTLDFDTDHTFSDPRAGEQLQAAVADWLLGAHAAAAPLPGRPFPSTLDRMQTHEA